MKKVKSKRVARATVLLVLLMATVSAWGQTDSRMTAIKAGLQSLEVETPGLSQTTELSVSGVPLDEFLRALAKTHKLNLSIDQELKEPVTNNFSNVSVSDVLYFLAERYELDYRFSANIIHISRYTPVVTTSGYTPKVLSIAKDSLTGLLTVDFSKDSLHQVTRQLVQYTGQNIVYKPSLQGKRVTLYLEEAPLQKVLEQLCFANDMSVTLGQDSVFRLVPPNSATTTNSRSSPTNRPRRTGPIAFTVEQDSTLTLEVESQPLSQIIKTIFGTLSVDYYYYSDLQGAITMKAYNESLDGLLQKLLNGTEYTYRNVGDSYYLGERELEGLRATERIHLKYRSIDKIQDFIPANLLKDLEVVVIEELNSLVVSGSYPQIQELTQYLKGIDVPVPVIQIEVMIIDHNRNHNIRTGLDMGIGQEPATSGGSIYPSVEYTLNAQSINQIISSLNGWGSVNLGPVTPNFYVSLKALETNGVIKTRSTPKLATLNGHEANIKIGKTEYYAVEQQSLQGVQNPIPIVTRNYQSVTADFTLTIRPFVSGEGEVTLEIEVEQSDFTTRIAPDAPPGQVKRTFTTIIRVKDGEMILIGGLEEKTTDNTGEGLPWFSRVPVLKWFFSNRNKVKSDNRLNIFIKPTIIE